MAQKRSTAEQIIGMLEKSNQPPPPQTEDRAYDGSLASSLARRKVGPGGGRGCAC